MSCGIMNRKEQKFYIVCALLLHSTKIFKSAVMMIGKLYVLLQTAVDCGVVQEKPESFEKWKTIEI
jgi:hypothetical protein